MNVILRVRPLISQESENAWFIDDNNIELLPTNSSRQSAASFQFPVIVEQEDTTQKIYTDYMGSIASNVVSGINCTIFAYGQSSSGKTHSMFGDNNNPGLIQLLLTDLFEKCKGTEFILKMQFVELYNEVVYDLLKPDNKPTIRDFEGHVKLEDAAEPRITSCEDCIALIDKGKKQRVISATRLNKQSSRSHAVIRIVLDSSDAPQLPTHNKAFKINRSAILTLVDLAGSERQSKTNASGVNLGEANSINKSLLNLGNVVNALAIKAQHVPYRNSKLTFLLQPSLGGNAISFFLGCISPSKENVTESIVTMKFLQRAMKIECKAKVNEFHTDAERLELVLEQNRTLKQKIRELENQLGVANESFQTLSTISQETSSVEESELSITELSEPIAKAAPSPSKVQIEQLERRINELQVLLTEKEEQNHLKIEEAKRLIEDQATDEMLLVSQKYQEDFDNQQKVDQRKIEDLLVMIDTLEKELNEYLQIETSDIAIEPELLAQGEKFTEIGQSLINFCLSEIGIQNTVENTDFEEEIGENVSVIEGQMQTSNVTVPGSAASNQTSFMGEENTVQTSILGEVKQAETSYLCEDMQAQTSLIENEEAQENDEQGTEELAVENCEEGTDAMEKEENSSVHAVETSFFVDDCNETSQVLATSTGNSVVSAESGAMETSRVSQYDVLVEYEIEIADADIETSQYEESEQIQYSELGHDNKIETSQVKENSVACQESEELATDESLETSRPHEIDEVVEPDTCESNDQMANRQLENTIDEIPIELSHQNCSPLRASPLRKMMRREDLSPVKEKQAIPLFEFFADENNVKTEIINLAKTQCSLMDMSRTLELGKTTDMAQMAETQFLKISEIAGNSQHKRPEVSLVDESAEVSKITLVDVELQNEVTSLSEQGNEVSLHTVDRSLQTTDRESGDRDKSLLQCQDKNEEIFANSEFSLEQLSKEEEFDGNNQSEGQENSSLVTYLEKSEEFLGDEQAVSVQKYLEQEFKDKSVENDGCNQEFFCQFSNSISQQSNGFQFQGDNTSKLIQLSADEQSLHSVSVFANGNTSEKEAELDLLPSQTDASVQLSLTEQYEVDTQCKLIVDLGVETEDGAYQFFDVEQQTACIEIDEKEVQTANYGCPCCDQLKKQLASESAHYTTVSSSEGLEIELLKQQSCEMQTLIESLQQEVAELEAENENLKCEQESRMVIDEIVLKSGCNQTEKDEISKSIQVYTSQLLSELSNSLTASNSMQLADASTCMTVTFKENAEPDYEQMYLELDEKFERLIADSREKIQLVVENAKKREEHLLLKVKEQFDDMKKYKDIVLRIQGTQLEKQALQKGLLGIEVPKSE